MIQIVDLHQWECDELTLPLTCHCKLADGGRSYREARWKRTLHSVVDHIGRHAGSVRYIQGSTCNHENEGKTNNLEWVLYSVYTELGVCCTRYMLYMVHQQRIFPSTRNGSVGVDALRQSCQRHPSGGSLHAQRLFNAARYISPSDRCFTVSSCSVGVVFQMITVELRPTVTKRCNGFIG